ncbi:MAG: hypothetical protein HC767_03280 [Akkermansiaceae bacterium]|nr:hypothetical protein [Akkermansiaceae bacterium]
MDEMIMAQRLEDEEAAAQEDREASVNVPEATVTTSNFEQLLNERSQLFAALAEAWGKEAEVSKILASTVTLPYHHATGVILAVHLSCLLFHVPSRYNSPDNAGCSRIVCL